MRVISGSRKKRALRSLKGLEVRPTPDRVREAIFDIIASELSGRKVLDLFAGSGTLGIEALSRGAKEAVFIETHHEAARILEENLRNCQFREKGTVIRGRVEAGIKLLAKRGESFDLIFLDPPYDKALIARTLKALSPSKILVPGSLVVAQHSPREIFPEALGRLILEDQRRYGETLVSFFRVS